MDRAFGISLHSTLGRGPSGASAALLLWRYSRCEWHFAR